MKLLLLFSLLIYSQLIYAQDADALVAAVSSKLALVKDYTADMHIKAQVPLIKIDEVDAKVYFKKPNQIKIESKAIAILPKQGMGELNQFLANDKAYTTALNGTKMLGDVKTSVVSLMPNSENADIILVKLWIDAQKELILKSQITSKTNGTLDVLYYYGSQAKYGLPYKMVFTIDVKKFKLPKSVAADLHQSKKTNTASNNNQTGTIVISMRNYVVNQGAGSKHFN